MGLTCAEVIERAKSEYLYAGNQNMPAFDILAADITNSATSMTVQGLTPYVPQSVLEFDDTSMELAFSKEAESTTTIDLNERGWLESAAAAHTAGVKIWVNPPYPKAMLFNVLKAVIGDLYGYGLYALTNSAGTLTYSDVMPLSLPTGATDVAGTIWVLDGTNYVPLYKGQDFEVIQAFSPPKIQFFSRGLTGRAIYFDYKKDFTAPTLITEDLTTLGVPSALQPHMATAVAAYVLMGRDVPEAQNEYVRQALVNEGTPLGARSSIGANLLRRFEQQVGIHRNRLLAEHPTRITSRR